MSGEAVRDHTCRTERYFLAVGFTMVSFLMAMAGIAYLDQVFGFADLDMRTYQMSRAVICIVLALCAGISISKGLVAGSILMIVTTISCGSFAAAAFLGVEPSSTQDPILSVLVFMVAYFFIRRKDIYLGIATILFGTALLSAYFLEGDGVNTVLGVGLLVSGILFATYSSATIVEGETGITKFQIGSVFRHTSIRGIAMNPYEMGVPLVCIFSGILIVFVSLFHLDGDLLGYGDVITVGMFTVFIGIMSVYLCLRNIVSEGLFHLLLTLELIAQMAPTLAGMEVLPRVIDFLIFVPSLAVTVLCFRKRDLVFALASLSFFLFMLLDTAQALAEVDVIPIQAYGALELVTAFLLLYHGLARWFLIAVRREVLPLFTRNIVRTERPLDSQWGMAAERKEWNTNAVSTDMGNIFMAILLVWVGFVYLNGTLELVHIDHHSYQASKLVISSLVMLFTVVSFTRGAVTEAIVFLMTGLSSLDFAILELLGHEGSPVADNIFGMFLFICGLFYLRRGHPVMGTATVLYAAGISAPQMVSGDLGNTVLALMLIASGFMYGYSALRRFVITVLHLEAKDTNRFFTDTHGLSASPYDTVTALGYIMLAAFILILAAQEDDVCGSIYTVVHSVVIMILGLYAIDKKLVAEGLSLLIPGMIMTMNGICTFVYGEHTPEMFWIFLSLMMVPTIVVFFINGEKVYGACNLCIVLSFVSIGISRFDPVGIALFAAVMLIMYNAFNNWFIIERNRSLFNFRRKMAPADDAAAEGNN